MMKTRTNSAGVVVGAVVHLHFSVSSRRSDEGEVQRVFPAQPEGIGGQAHLCGRRLREGAGKTLYLPRHHL